MKMTSKDPDIRASLPALKRAAKSAFKLAKATGTPFFVMKKGKIVNLNPTGRKRAAR
jgi:hypothetical protein